PPTAVSTLSLHDALPILCHTVQGEGGRVGPDLSRIGASRSDRDLLEAILFPSASFARGFEPFVVATDDGRIYSGVVARETADALDRKSTRLNSSHDQISY